MNVKLVLEDLVFISSINATDFAKAKKFCPEVLKLKHRDVESGKSNEVFMFDTTKDGSGSVEPFGIVFDTTTEDGYLAITLIGRGGIPNNTTQADKLKAAIEQFAKPVMLAGELEKQIAEALAAHNEMIDTATSAFATVNI